MNSHNHNHKNCHHRVGKTVQNAEVLYQISVLNADGSVAQSMPTKRNLILDQGLNNKATQGWGKLFSRAAVGTGVTPTKRDSAAVTFTRAANVVTASAGFFEAADVGRLLKFDSGEEMYITAFTSNLEVTVNSTGALAASEGTVWYVDQTGLTTEVKRTASYGADGGDNGQTWLSPTWTFKRTFIFSVEAAPITYNEIGWSHLADAGGNLFGRDLIPGGVALAATQQLKVVVSLVVTYSPVVPTTWVNPIVGFGTDGEMIFESVGCNCVDAAGNGGGNGPLDPSSAGFTWTISPITTALPAGPDTNVNGTDLSGAGQVPTAANQLAYVPGTFFKDYVATFGVGSANGTTWRSIGEGGDPGGGQWRTWFRILMSGAGTKDSDHTLSFTFRISWGRTLVN